MTQTMKRSCEPRPAAGGVRMTLALLAVLLFGGAACGGSSPTTPGDPSPPVTPPGPPASNTPPTITSLAANSPRVEADGEIVVTAVVADVETPVDRLTYEWSSSPARGTFAGQGRQVRWVAPHLQPTPDVYTLTLTVTENYADPSSGEAKQLKTARSVDVHYNDSYVDMTRISMRFLTELFPSVSVTPQLAVQDFSDTCPGKLAERDQIENNRRLFLIESGTFSISSINLNTERTSGTVVGRCVFKDTVRATGVHETVAGVCTLQTVYENWVWRLCDSSFAGTDTTTALSALSGRVPGSITSR
jgi:hypothetical protein